MANNKAFSLITGLVLVVGLFGFIPTILPLRTSQEVACKLAAMFFISLYFIKNIWLKLFLGYCILMVFLRINPQSLIVLQTMFFFIIMFQVLADKLNEKRVKHILDIICFIGLVQAIIMLLQYIGIWFMYMPLNYKDYIPVLEFFKNSPFAIVIYTESVAESMRWNLTGLTSNPNMASALLALCFPACLRKDRLWIILFLGLALILNSCLQGIIAGLIISFIYIINKIKPYYDRIILTIIVIIILSFWLFSNNHWKVFLMPDRIPVWKFCIKNIILNHPFVGIGLGLGQRIYQVIESNLKIGVSYCHPHNEYIFLAMETGLIGFSLMMLFIFKSIYKFIINGLDSIKLIVLLGIISGLLNCIVSFTSHVTIMMIFIVYLSIMQYKNQMEVVV